VFFFGLYKCYSGVGVVVVVTFVTCECEPLCGLAMLGGDVIFKLSRKRQRGRVTYILFLGESHKCTPIHDFLSQSFFPSLYY
jgi:hypothetical protein